MENFELIDRFFEKDLSPQELEEFERRLNEEDTFQEDLRFYEAMNNGVHSLERHRLKKKLDQLYDEHASHGPHVKNGYPWVWISGIAASVLIAGYFFLFRVENPEKEIAKEQEPQQEEQVAKDDTSDSEPSKEHEDEVINSDETSELPDEVLAFGGIATLPPRHVMTFSYPRPLFYTFDGRTLQLRGDPLLPALALDMVKKDENQYQLNYLNTAYELRTSGTFIPLSEPTTRISGTPSSEIITVVFESALSAATRDDRLKVKINKQRGKPGFVYDESNEITIAGNFELHNTQVYAIEFQGEEFLLVKRDSDLFILEGKPTSLKDMEKASTVNNKLPALFEERNPLKLEVQTP